MTGAWLSAVTLIPLGLYFGVLGVWHGGRHPRVLAGLADWGLLLLGVGGVVAFGPVGQFIMAAVFGVPGWEDWVAFLALLGLLASMLARRSLTRTVVYHIDRPALEGAMSSTLREIGPDFRRTLGGYEQAEQGRWITIEVSPRLGTAVVEAHGKEAEALSRGVRRGLRARLTRVEVPPARGAALFVGLGAFLIAAPMIGSFLAQPGTRSAFRALLDHIRSR